MTTLVAMTVVAPVGYARGPKPALYTGASVHVRDWTGDAITSDGADYIDGLQRGLEVRMWINGSQDLTIGTFQSGRTITFTYTPAVDLTGNGTAPNGVLVDNAFVNVHNIAAMGVGDSKVTRVSVQTAIGHFRWLGAPPIHPTGNSESYGSQAVVVTRLNSTTWDVFTPVPSDEETFAPSVAGDLAVLLRERKGALVPAGLYHMAFGLTVTCTSCP
jgi:hypothetical protein